MGLFDQVKGAAEQAGELAAEHGDAVQKGIDKAADAADGATGGRFSGAIDKAAEVAGDKVQELGDRQR